MKENFLHFNRESNELHSLIEANGNGDVSKMQNVQNSKMNYKYLLKFIKI